MTTAKALLHVNASAADVSAGFKHLDHVGSVKHSAAVKVKTEYLEAQKKADEIAASRAAAAARREAAEQNALSELSRIAAAKTMENKMLDEGMNVDVKAIGPKHTVLHIKYIFVNKVFAHKLSENSEMFNSLRKAGFKKLVATDGYDEQWTWQL